MSTNMESGETPHTRQRTRLFSQSIPTPSTHRNPKSQTKLPKIASTISKNLKADEEALLLWSSFFAALSKFWKAVGENSDFWKKNRRGDKRGKQGKRVRGWFDSAKKRLRKIVRWLILIFWRWREEIEHRDDDWEGSNRSFSQIFWGVGDCRIMGELGLSQNTSGGRIQQYRSASVGGSPRVSTRHKVAVSRCLRDADEEIGRASSQMSQIPLIWVNPLIRYKILQLVCIQILSLKLIYKKALEPLKLYYVFAFKVKSFGRDQLLSTNLIPLDINHPLWGYTHCKIMACKQIFILSVFTRRWAIPMALPIVTFQTPSQPSNQICVLICFMSSEHEEKEIVGERFLLSPYVETKSITNTFERVVNPNEENKVREENALEGTEKTAKLKVILAPNVLVLRHSALPVRALYPPGCDVWCLGKIVHMSTMLKGSPFVISWLGGE